MERKEKNKENMLGFKIFKVVLGGLFKLYYNPKFIGKENIPTDGPILVVGNHIMKVVLYLRTIGGINKYE